VRPPDFLLIGAQKSGTSWLAHMLRQHPDIYIPPTKELHFFNERENYQRGIDWYLHQFENHEGAVSIGECTPNYLWVGEIPDYVSREFPIRFSRYPQLRTDTHELVHRHFPNVKLLVSLRSPVDRAISSYYHAIRARRVSPRSSILDAGGREGIIAMGFYHEQLSAWLGLFPRNRFRILIYEEDIRHRRERTVASIYQHLGVDSTFHPTHIDLPRNRRASQVFMRVNYYSPLLARRFRRVISRLDKIEAIPINSKDRIGLTEIYEEEIRRLEQLLGRSLDVWRTPGAM